MEGEEEVSRIMGRREETRSFCGKVGRTERPVQIKRSAERWKSGENDEEEDVSLVRRDLRAERTEETPRGLSWTEGRMQDVHAGRAG